MTVAEKIAIITGAARGMGRTCAEKLLEEGAKGVVLVDILEDRGKQTSEELGAKYECGRVLYIQCDVTITEQLRNVYHQTLQRFGQFDIVINNAAIIDEINYEKAIAVNMTAVITSSYMAMSHMRKDKGGRGGIIINVASIAATWSKVPFIVVYTATKHGIVSFTKSIAKNIEDVDKYGIRVASLLPCKMHTELLDYEAWRNLVPVREEDVTQPLVQANARTLAKFLDEAAAVPALSAAKAVLELVSEPQCNGAVLELSPGGSA